MHAILPLNLAKASKKADHLIAMDFEIGYLTKMHAILPLNLAKTSQRADHLIAMHSAIAFLTIFFFFLMHANTFL